MSLRLPLRAYVALLLLVVPRLHSQPMALDPSFAPAIESSMSVTKFVRVVPAPAGQMLTLGDSEPGLTYINEAAVAHRLARLLSDGTPDEAFAAQLPDPHDVVRDALALADGRVWVTTRSTTGLQPGRVLRLLANGQIDPTFTPLALSGDGRGYLVASTDGSVILWGSFNAVGGIARNSVARILPAGSIDPGFAPAITDAALTVISLVATTDGGAVLNAQGYKQDQPLSFHFNRLTRTGAIDPSFSPAPPDRTFLIVGVLSDNRLLILRNGLHRLNADGSNDTTYSPSVALAENIRGAILLPGDRLAVEAATPFSSVRDGVPSVYVLKPDGTNELDCRTLSGAERIQSLRGVRSDGSIVIAQGPLIRERAPYSGSSPELVAGMDAPRLCVVNPTARTLTALPMIFEARGEGRVRRVAADSTGGVVVEGYFSRIAGVRRPGLARFKLDGSIDPTFDPVALTPLFRLPDGGIIASRTTLGPADAEGFHDYVTRVVRLMTNGTLDPAFTPAENLDLLNATWLATDTLGRILVCVLEGGVATDANVKLVWLASNGARSSTLATTFSGVVFSPGTSPASSGQPIAVQSAAVLPDGKLLLRVLAPAINGAPPTLLVRLNADGSTDTTYRPSSTFDQLQDISGAKPLPDGRGYVYGTRVGAGWWQPFAVMRLEVDGSPDTFVPIALVDGIRLSDGSYVYSISRYHPDGSYDLNYQLRPDHSNDYFLQSAVLTTDGALWIAGLFSTISDQPRHGLARLVPNEVAGFTRHPDDRVATIGYGVTFQAEIGTAAPASFQWTRNGTPIPGATSRTLTIDRTKLADAGEYRLVATVGNQTYTSEPGTLTVEPNRAHLVNFSARSAVANGHPPQIGGFVLSGPSPREVLLRAVGGGLPVDNPGFALLPEPRLTLFRERAAIATDAGGALAGTITAAANRVGAAALRPTNPAGEATRDSALLLALGPGVYTAQTHSNDGREGVSLFEFYDAAASTGTPAIVNASIRGRAAPGDDVLIAGFVIGGQGALRVLIRGLGPELEARGVSGAVTDPRITLYREQTALITNNDWSEQVDVADLTAASQRVGAAALPTGSRDAVLLAVLQPGVYTVHGSATDRAAGEMLIEIFVDE